MRASIGFFAATALLVSGVTFADEPSWYGGVSLGYTELSAGDEFAGASFKDTALGVGLLAGYQQSKYIAWEGELQTSGVAKESVVVGGAPLDLEAKYETWAIGIVAMYPFADRFTVFGRFLPMYGRYTLESSSEKQTVREGGYTVGAGAAAQFGALNLRLRYDLQRVNFENDQSIENPERIGLDALFRF